MTWESVQVFGWNLSAYFGMAVALALVIAFVRGFEFSMTLGRPSEDEGELDIPDDYPQLKSWPEFFEAQWERLKPFEVRVNDRDFQAGDFYFVREWLPDRDEHGHPDRHKGAYSGRWLEIEVTYVLSLDMLRSLGLDTGKLEQEWCVFTYEEVARGIAPQPRFLELEREPETA